MIYLFDITSRESFHNLDRWHTSISPSLGECKHFAVVGNKTDLKHERKVSREEGVKWTEQHLSQFEHWYFETSSKDSSGLGDLFKTVVGEMIRLSEIDQPSVNIKPAGCVRLQPQHQSQY